MRSLYTHDSDKTATRHHPESPLPNKKSNFIIMNTRKRIEKRSINDKPCSLPILKKSRSTNYSRSSKIQDNEYFPSTEATEWVFVKK